MKITIDLETMGNTSNSAIVSIGAVAFENEIVNEFECNIDLQSCIDKGLVVTASTVLWWINQSETAKQAISKPNALKLEQALIQFSLWMMPYGKREVWGNGSDFDNVILSNAYRACDLPLPWQWYNNRCYRTAKAMYPYNRKQSSTAHTALQDARDQAVHLITILRPLSL